MNDVMMMKVDLYDFAEQQKQLMLMILEWCGEDKVDSIITDRLRALQWTIEAMAEHVNNAVHDCMLEDEYAQIEVPMKMTPMFGWRLTLPDTI